MGLIFFKRKEIIVMINDKLVLKDNTEITLESSQGIGALYVRTESKDAACELWGKFTKENLKQVTVKNADDLVIGNYPDMILDHMEGRDNTDGTVLVTFSLRSRSVLELMEERLDAVEAGLQARDEAIQTHNEAIGDLGQAVSDIAEVGV